MKTSDKIENIMRSFEDTCDAPFSLSETRRLVNLSFTMLTAITLVLSIGIAVSISTAWEVKKENAVLREAISRIDPFVIQDAESYIGENPFLID